MKTSPQNVISCLYGDLEIEHNLIIEAIREDEETLGQFRETVEDFTEYPRLLEMVSTMF